ncbi:MAG: GNAT family N-acetyltransferase [Nanoarchaeota archaeon]|nr:GNAT family N-acetyltransferase [Nanoarchaeota archaeon]MBU4301017.1 GNAT family N-acetyltransferase [Nanoarchaeota archaeon]MBU4452468.1 GNAT family N-acetyltransferase [Nanoarchaeota archaeon]MCG2723998.1 GNAT family N-acetyltransferase [archaeon]
MNKMPAKNKILVKEVPIEEAVKVNLTIPEFDERSRTEEYFADRYKGKENLIIAAYFENKPAGYLVGYDRFKDGSFYCWMAGVALQFREKGILAALMDYLESWAKARGYKKIRIKTRNNRREMLTYLVKYGFYFTEVEKYPNAKENRILAEKVL